MSSCAISVNYMSMRSWHINSCYSRASMRSVTFETDEHWSAGCAVYPRDSAFLENVRRFSTALTWHAGRLQQLLHCIQCFMHSASDIPAAMHVHHEFRVPVSTGGGGSAPTDFQAGWPRQRAGAGRQQRGGKLVRLVRIVPQQPQPVSATQYLLARCCSAVSGLQ